MKKYLFQISRTIANFAKISVEPVNANESATYTRSPKDVTKVFYTALTKHGVRRDDILARCLARLRLRFNHPAPLDLAVDALRPVVKYVRPKDGKYYMPVAVWPTSGVGMAVRWVVKAAAEKKFKGERPNLERGLYEELEAVLLGTSLLFNKKIAMHRNPN